MPGSDRPRTRLAAVHAEVPAVLLVSDEWTPTRGGISRFNRSLAIAFAEEGYRTACLVRDATDVEREDAENHGVELFQAVVTPAGPDLSVSVSEVVAWRPDIVIGHELVSGSVAWTYTNYYVPTASLVYILHTVSLNEHYKSYPDTARRATDREREIERTAASAAVVAAVGPLLKRRGEAALGENKVMQLVPGMDIPDDPRWLRRRPPANSIVLMACRTNHIEAKGLDIAAGAIAGLRLPRQLPPVELRIRGAHGDSCDSLKTDLLGRVRVARHQIDVREYTADPAELARDIGQAALFIMPSRAEGFGLAALEAIGLGTPVLVSDRSGLADLLDDCLGEFAKPMIVPVVDDWEHDVSTWRAVIEAKLQDLPRAFTYAHDVRKMLLPQLRWGTAVSALVSRLPVPVPRAM